MNPRSYDGLALVLAEPASRPRWFGERSTVGWWRRYENMAQVRSYAEAYSLLTSRIRLRAWINHEQTATASP